MTKIRELLRLRFVADLSIRQIARSQNLSTGVVSKYIQRAQEQGSSWPLPDDLTDQALQTMVQRASSVSLAEPDFSFVQDELKQKGMTILLAWEEYAQDHPHHAALRLEVSRSGL